ncbi:hypothetical protein DIPPA_35405 [Diplonema papillatum]|nr:hypothetical protein DIPPA_35405 [Diplonema papillatum]
MPGELHIIRQLSHATNSSKKNLFVLWEAVTGSHWEPIEGNEQGQTHILEDSGGPAGAVFAHPIDLHNTQNIQSWPKPVVHVWHQDNYGRKDFVSYGVAYLSPSELCDATPVCPITHLFLECKLGYAMREPMWRQVFEADPKVPRELPAPTSRHKMLWPLLFERPEAGGPNFSDALDLDATSSATSSNDWA